MTTPLMPKATAVWLIDNTALTFAQIADFCHFHLLEIQAIADGEVSHGMVGMDPIANGQLTRDEIARCEKDETQSLRMSLEAVVAQKNARQKGAKYTPVNKRGDKPDAIIWLVKNYPALSDNQIIRLIGTTKTTITAIRDKTHRSYSSLTPKNPVLLGLCSQSDLDQEVESHEPRVLEQ